MIAEKFCGGIRLILHCELNEYRHIRPYLANHGCNIVACDHLSGVNDPNFVANISQLGQDMAADDDRFAHRT